MPAFSDSDWNQHSAGVNNANTNPSQRQNFTQSLYTADETDFDFDIEFSGQRTHLSPLETGRLKARTWQPELRPIYIKSTTAIVWGPPGECSTPVCQAAPGI